MTACAEGLGAHDWQGYAEAVGALCPALGAYEALHAEAADHCSPDVDQWPRYVADDRDELIAAGCSPGDAAAAERLWQESYGSAP